MKHETTNVKSQDLIAKDNILTSYIMVVNSEQLRILAI